MEHIRVARELEEIDIPEEDQESNITESSPPEEYKSEYQRMLHVASLNRQAMHATLLSRRLLDHARRQMTEAPVAFQSQSEAVVAEEPSNVDDAEDDDLLSDEKYQQFQTLRTVIRNGYVIILRFT